MAHTKVRPLTYICPVEADDRPAEADASEGSLAVCRDTAKSYIQQDGTWTDITGGGGGITDGDKGDITVSGSGSVWEIDSNAVGTTEIANDAVTFDKIQNIATDRVLGRDTSGSGNIEELTLAANLQISGGQLSAIGTAVRRPHFDNPPTSAHAYDDEFDTGSLDAKWTLSSSATTNPVTTGSVDYTANLTTPIIDPSTMASWCLFQSDNSGGGFINITQNYTPDTDSTFFVKLMANNFPVSTNVRGDIELNLFTTADANERIAIGIHKSGTAYIPYIQVENNGAITNNFGVGVNEGVPLEAWYFALWKKSDVYHGAVAVGYRPFTYINSATKTGVTTFDRFNIRNRTAGETPSGVAGIDFIRYYASLNYSLYNA